ncbi:MAG: transcriptional regulator [Bacteroidetes bacterium B1(2017)]|nr:MAG: transcriptional regulator [Bacteroidetes bacterium B1(2017)]
MMDLSTSLIRFWEKEFSQLKPRKTEGGTRKYSQADVAMLKRIYQLVKIEGFTIAGAKEKLKEKQDTPADIEAIKIKLSEIRNFLVELKDNLS